jgi:hypothetical protein
MGCRSTAVLQLYVQAEWSQIAQKSGSAVPISPAGRNVPRQLPTASLRNNRTARHHRSVDLIIPVRKALECLLKDARRNELDAAVFL